jgi:hypothetical protein
MGRRGSTAGCGVDDEALGQLRAPLLRLPNLECLSLGGTAVTERGARSLPDTVIRLDDRSF